MTAAASRPFPSLPLSPRLAGHPRPASSPRPAFIRSPVDAEANPPSRTLFSCSHPAISPKNLFFEPGMKVSFPPASRGERYREVDKQGNVVAVAAADASTPGVGGVVPDPSGDLDGGGGVNGQGAQRSLLGFMEAKGKSSNRCIPCQYSEKVSVDEPDPNCYLIVLAWIPNGTGLNLNKYL